MLHVETMNMVPWMTIKWECNTYLCIVGHLRDMLMKCMLMP